MPREGPIDPEALRRRYEAILQTVGDGIIGLDAKGQVTFASPAAVRHLGYALDSLVGQNAQDTFHRVSAEDSAILASLADGTVHHVRGGESFTRKDRKTLPVEYTVTPTRNGNNEIVGAVVVFRPQVDRAAVPGGAISRPTVRKIVHGLIEAGAIAHPILLQLGRRLAIDMQGTDVESYLRAYIDLGLGEIKLEKAEEGRFSFSGNDLLERKPGSRVATCFFTLGFLSEAASRASGGEPTLGTEIDCQSRGSHHCKFVVQVRKAEEGLARRVKELV